MANGQEQNVPFGDLYQQATEAFNNAQTPVS